MSDQKFQGWVWQCEKCRHYGVSTSVEPCASCRIIIQWSTKFEPITETLNVDFWMNIYRDPDGSISYGSTHATEQEAFENVSAGGGFVGRIHVKQTIEVPYDRKS